MSEKKLKIVFFGTPEFAVASLDRLLKDGQDIAAVVTMPDKIAGRGHKLIQSDVKQYAVANGLKVLQPERLKAPEFVEELRNINADLFIVIAFRMLPEIVWSMPPMGTFNLHASLLPKYRGAAPINWAVIKGETETGVTTFFLKHEIDTGDIIEQRKIEILPEDNVGHVHDRLMILGADMVSHTVKEIAAGTVVAQPQPEGEFIPAPKISPLKLCPCITVSDKIPAIFLPSTRTSLGHLILGSRPYSSSISHKITEKGMERNEP